MAADCKPTSGLSETSFSTKQTAKNSSSNIMGGNRKKSQSNSKRTRVRDHRVRPSSSTALRLDKPSSLNSVFVSSLSSKGVSKAPKKKLIKVLVYIHTLCFICFLFYTCRIVLDKEQEDSKKLQHDQTSYNMKCVVCMCSTVWL